MSDTLHCYRCGYSLASLSLPLARLDECTQCRAELHVCRMCRHYDKSVVRACTEDDAPEIRDKVRANFCDYFKPSPDAGDSAEWQREQRARAQLGALFGEDGVAAGDSAAAAPAAEQADADEQADAEARRHAEALFRK